MTPKNPIDELGEADEKLATEDAPTGESNFPDLELYVSGRSRHSVAAVRAVRKICEGELRGNYRLTIVDILKDPAAARHADVLVTPTLIARTALVETKSIGNAIYDRTRLRALLQTEHEADLRSPATSQPLASVSAPQEALSAEPAPEPAAQAKGTAESEGVESFLDTPEFARRIATLLERDDRPCPYCGQSLANAPRLSEPVEPPPPLEDPVTAAGPAEPEPTAAAIAHVDPSDLSDLSDVPDVSDVVDVADGAGIGGTGVAIASPSREEPVDTREADTHDGDEGRAQATSGSRAVWRSLLD